MNVASQHTTASGNVTPEFAELLVRLAAVYPTTGKLSEATIRVYARVLGDVPLDTLRQACARAARECRIFPVPAELLRFIGVTAEDQALLAWAALRQAAADVGGWVSLEVEDARTAAALQASCGGWPQYCALEEGPEMATRRQEFLAAWRAAHAKGLRAVPGSPVRLAGTLEARGGPVGGLSVARLAPDGTARPAPPAKALPAEGEP